MSAAPFQHFTQSLRASWQSQRWLFHGARSLPSPPHHYTLPMTDSNTQSAPRGDVHRWSRTLIPTTREAPSDAESAGHQLLVRAGYIRRVGAGMYNYLPLAWRVLRKVSQIIREEMNSAGAAEMLMPALEPIELMKQTGRDEAYGDNLFRLTDRHGRTIALAPTHEEIITDMMKGAVSSYKQLPINLYQIQTKFRDEFRPRSALLRGREFIMKDAYSFHTTIEGPGGLNEAYDAMHRAYVNIFTRCGLDFTVVEAESGPIGGSASHEFMVNCESGEDTILRCPQSGYAANVEKCETGERKWSFEGDPTGDLDKVHTPNLPGIEEVGKFMKVKPPNMLKTIVFQTATTPQPSPPGRGQGEGSLISSSSPTSSPSSSPPSSGQGKGSSSTASSPTWILTVVRGDHEVNESKVKDAAGAPVQIADEKQAKQAGFAIGYVSPRAILERTGAILIIDPDAARAIDETKGKPMFWATGADEPDHHVKHFNWRRELGAILDDPSRVKVADIRNAMAGDPSPRAEGATLEAARGIEVGHIFKLGTKYSEAMGFTVLDQSQQRNPVIMGCYGVGVSRTMQACVEMSHDDDGIVWPHAIAPYHVHIIPMKLEPDSEHMRTAEKLAKELSENGLDVLIDDRDERPGVKFKDADLIGCPLRITIGDKALEQGCVEVKKRSEGGKGEMVKVEEAVRVI
ncbi:MAG: proline--tRNA ligase [Phycisphaeraceae bacterium]|nr:MAG: proline--tRNA ligase [Phycisphaeraceae bacterium]